MRILGHLEPESFMSMAIWFHYVQMQKSGEKRTRAPGWHVLPGPFGCSLGRSQLSYYRNEG